MRLNELIVLATMGVFALVKADESNCDILYNGHCLVVLLNHPYNHADSRIACDEIGGRLANIYSDDEMQQIEEYLDQNRMEEIYRLDLRTGMTFRSGKLWNSDGSVSNAQLRWSRTWPRDIPGWDNVILTVVKLWDIDGFHAPEGLVNKPSFSSYFQLCEIP